MDWAIRIGVETRFLLAAVLFDVSDRGRRPRHRLPLDHSRQARFGTGRLPPDEESAVTSLPLWAWGFTCAALTGGGGGLTCGR